MVKRTITHRTVGILLFDGVELLDYAGPAEVFTRASPPKEDSRENMLFQIITLAEEKTPIKPTSGSQIIQDYTLTDHPPLDILVIPGGQGTRDQERRARITPWILEQDKSTELTTSVCTGAFFLADARLLSGKKATTHWKGRQWMRDNHPEIILVTKQRYVDEGHIITSAGISAGIDMALHVVKRLHGRATAVWTARLMEYPLRRTRNR